MNEVSGLTAFGRIVRAEWTKLRTVRSMFWIFLAMVLVTAGPAVFVGATESLQPDDTVLGGSLTGAIVGQLVAAAIGALAVSGEYGTGLILSTFVAMPGRGSVLAAKAVVVAVPVYVAALASCGVAFLIGSAMLSGGGFATGSLWPELFGIALCFSGTALVGLALGALLRHPAGAVSAATGLILLPGLLGPLFGDLQRWVAGVSPAAPLRKLAQSSDATAETVGGLGAWASLTVLCASTLVMLLLAGSVLRRRDV
jgi:ABC-2 type transport system permease protein